MTDITQLESGDELGINDTTFTVTDVEIEDIGLAEVFAVTMTTVTDAYVLKGHTDSTTAELVGMSEDGGEVVEIADIGYND